MSHAVDNTVLSSTQRAENAYVFNASRAYVFEQFVVDLFNEHIDQLFRHLEVFLFLVS